MDRLQELKKVLTQEKNDEYRIHLIIEHAVNAVDELIMEGTSSREETNYLTSSIVQKLQEKIHSELRVRLLCKMMSKF